MACYLSHTTVNCRNAYDLSEWWKRLLAYTDVPGDPNEPGHDHCMIIDPDIGQRLLFVERGIHLTAEGEVGRLSRCKSPRAAVTAGGMDDTEKGCTSWISLPWALVLVGTTRLIWRSCVPGFPLMVIAWTILISSDGLRASYVRAARLKMPSTRLWATTGAVAAGLEYR